jgi:hypothetical protein
MRNKGKQLIPKSEITMTTWPCGLHVHHFDPQPEEFDIRDIAHHLALTCRFVGGVPFHYSTAQHSIYVWQVLMRIKPESDPREQMHALLHDAGDGYWGDLHSQAKRKIPAYQKAYKGVEAVIWKKFNLESVEPFIVKKADGIMLSTELVTLKGGHPHKEEPLNDFKIKRWSPERAEREFNLLYQKLRRLRISNGDPMLDKGT